MKFIEMANCKMAACMYEVQEHANSKYDPAKSFRQTSFTYDCKATLSLLNFLFH